MKVWLPLGTASQCYLIESPIVGPTPYNSVWFQLYLSPLKFLPLFDFCHQGGKNLEKQMTGRDGKIKSSQKLEEDPNLVLLLKDEYLINSQIKYPQVHLLWHQCVGLPQHHQLSQIIIGASLLHLTLGILSDSV